MTKQVIATCVLDVKGVTKVVELSLDRVTKLYMVTKNGVIEGTRLADVDEAQHEFAAVIMSFKL